MHYMSKFEKQLQYPLCHKKGTFLSYLKMVIIYSKSVISQPGIWNFYINISFLRNQLTCKWTFYAALHLSFLYTKPTAYKYVIKTKENLYKCVNNLNRIGCTDEQYFKKKLPHSLKQIKFYAWIHGKRHVYDNWTNKM